MRKRTLLAVVLLTFALPAVAQPPKANPDTLTAIADLQADFAFDVFATPRAKAELIDSARENYLKALQIDPKHKDALLGLARLHARTGEREKSVEVYKKYLKLYPNDVQVRRELTRLDGACALHRFGTGGLLVVDDPPGSLELVPLSPGRGVGILGGEVRAEPVCVTIDTVVVKVPRSFIAQSGLNAGGPPDAKSWTLSPRETQMLRAVIQRDPERKVLSEPRVCTQDGRMACIRIGGEIQMLLPGDEPRIHYLPTGLSLELTPKVSADGDSVALAIDYGNTAPGENVPGPLLQRAQYADNPATCIQTIRAKETLRFGESFATVVGSTTVTNSFCGAVRTLSDSEPFVTLVIVTPTKGVPEQILPQPW
jgi:hypothetical protein